MGTVVQIHDLVIRFVPTTELAPPSGDECAHACRLDSFEEKARHLVGLVNDDTTKAYIHGRRPLAQKAIQLIWRIVARRIPKEKATYICPQQSV